MRGLVARLAPALEQAAVLKQHTEAIGKTTAESTAILSALGGEAERVS